MCLTLDYQIDTHTYRLFTTWKTKADPVGPTRYAHVVYDSLLRPAEAPALLRQLASDIEDGLRAFPPVDA